MNIRGISNKSNFLAQPRVKSPAVGISKTWLDDCYHFSDIAGYKFLFIKFLRNQKEI